MDFKDFTVLYVEDEEIIRLNVQKCLNFVFNVLVAKDAEEAVQLFNENKVDLVITDVCLPQKDGISMLKDIKTVNPEIPCIITSAFDSKKFDEFSVSQSCKYLPKPFDMKELLNHCLKALEVV